MVRRPTLFLMDEPFAKVDPHLRGRLRRELRLIQQGYGVTTVFVTNDPSEATVMGDRIAVLRRDDSSRLVHRSTSTDSRSTCS